MEASSWEWLIENIVHSCIDLFLIYKAEVAITSFWSNSHLILKVKTVCIHPLHPLLPKPMQNPLFLLSAFSTDYLRSYFYVFICWVEVALLSCFSVLWWGVLLLWWWRGGGVYQFQQLYWVSKAYNHALPQTSFLFFSVKLNHDSYHLQRWNQYADKRLVLHQTLIQDVTTTRPAHKLYMIGITGCASN